MTPLTSPGLRRREGNLLTPLGVEASLGCETGHLQDLGHVNNKILKINIEYFRAYNRVKEKLPNKKNINSKKQIIDEVRYVE